MSEERTSQEEVETRKDRYLNLMQRSWEMELLLFGIGLVFMFQLPGRVMKWIRLTKYTVARDIDAFMDILAMALMIGIVLTIFFMIVHLLMRTFWIALVGLNSAIPQGVDLKKLKLNPYFADRLGRMPGIDVLERRLEDRCSMTFTMTLLVFFCWLAIGIFVCISYGWFRFWGITHGSTSTLYQYIGVIGFLVYLIFSLIHAIDFISLGRIKRIRWKGFAVPYYYVYKVFSLLTLSFIYRPLYYSLITHSPKAFSWIMGTFVVGVLTIGIPDYSDSIFFPDDGMKGRMEATHYEEDIPSQEVITEPIIEKKRVEGQYLRLFLPYEHDLHDTLRSFPGIERFHKKGFEFPGIVAQNLQEEIDRSDEEENKNAQMLLSRLQELYSIRIDERTVETPEFRFHEHPRNEIPGFLTYLPLDSLNSGWHRLNVKLPIQGGTTSIPFFYEGNTQGSPIREKGRSKNR